MDVTLMHYNVCVCIVFQRLYIFFKLTLQNSQWHNSCRCKRNSRWRQHWPQSSPRCTRDPRCAEVQMPPCNMYCHHMSVKIGNMLQPKGGMYVYSKTVRVVVKVSNVLHFLKFSACKKEKNGSKHRFSLIDVLSFCYFGLLFDF